MLWIKQQDVEKDMMIHKEKDTTVVDYYETDEYKEFVETMYDWQQKGYLSKDAATTTESAENQVKAGAAFSFTVA